MPDTLYDVTRGLEITPFISKTIRTPSLTQVVNVSLNGLPHIQNIGAVSYQTRVEFVIHSNNDPSLMVSWRQGSLMRVIDSSVERLGYIISLELGEDYADGYHTGSILLQEEVTA